MATSRIGDMPSDSHTEIDRTTPIGLFNYARSWWRSGEQLLAAPPKVTHPHSPISFLLYQAIELYLKALLRSYGRSVDDLKKLRHGVTGLVREAEAVGFTFEPEHKNTLLHMDDENLVIESRYIETGFKQWPTANSLSSVCSRLDRDVAAALAAKGHAVSQAQAATPPAASGSDDDLAQITEEYIPFMSPRDRQIIGHLLFHNERMFEADMDGGHARRLISKGIARCALRRGQVFDFSDVPFEIPIAAWRVLERHRDRFPYQPDENGGDPWRVHWMER